MDVFYLFLILQFQKIFVHDKIVIKTRTNTAYCINVVGIKPIYLNNYYLFKNEI